jgi:carotenoid cleavage dioxygenase-like enzyme
MTTERFAPDVAPAISNPYLAGNFGPIHFETTAFALPFTGAIPKELAGRFVRIGPNPVRQLPDQEHYHWFTGTGMLHGLRLSNGKADWYRSRYVRVGPGPRGIGLKPLPGPTGSNDLAVNTNVVRAGDKSYALVEGGAFPVEFSYELESIARSDLGGGLSRGFSAHPKRDPATGELHAFAYQPGVPNVQYIVVGVDGVAEVRCEISLPHMPEIHDIAITQSSVVILDLPVTFQPAGGSALPYLWNERQLGRVGLLPRNGNPTAIQWFEAPECFVFHFLNAYDSGESVIVDVCRHPKMFATDIRGTNEGKPVLARWVLDRKTGRLVETVVDDHGTEFPRINGAYEGLPYRYGYTAGWKENVEFGPTMKHDLATGATDLHHHGPGRAALEPVFVAREGATGEDDGWILSYVYDGDRNASDVVILSAQDVAGPPVATIQLPVRVPFGFHGNWLPDPA